jgi:NitT/TauT family transport system substrate-binding protein
MQKPLSNNTSNQSWISKKNYQLSARAALASLTVGALALTACGGNDATANGEQAEGELQEVTVGAIAIADVAPLHLAVQEGFFEEEGLDVEIVETSGGAVSLPGVVSGDYDFAFLNVVSLMIARDQGMDVEFIANGTSTTGEPGADNIGIIATEDSPLETTADLTGSQSTSNQLNNIGDVATRLAVDNAGGDGSDVEFIELAFGEAQAAVENGNVESALLAEPYLTQALDAGLKLISSPYAEAHPELDTGGYFTTSDTVENDPEMVEAFQRAINRSLEYSDENPEAVRDIVADYTEIDEEILQRIQLPQFKPEFSRESLEDLGQSALEHGYLTEAPDLDALLPEQ